MPCRLHFDGIENPVGIFRLRFPIAGGEGVIGVALHVQRRSGLKRLRNRVVTGAIDDGIDVHVLGELRARASSRRPVRMFTTPSGTSLVARISAKATAGSGLPLGGEHDDRVARKNRRRDETDEREQRRRVGQSTPTTPVGSGKVKLKCGEATGFTVEKSGPYLSVQPA